MTKLAVELPTGYAHRAASWDDDEAILAVIIAADIEDVGEPDFTLSDLHADWREPGFDLADQARVVTTPDGTIVAYAEATAVDDGAVAYCGNYTHPAHRPAGLDAWAVAWSVERARTIARSVGAPTIKTHAAPGELRLPHLETAGFTVVRNFLRMEIALDAWTPVDGLADDDVVIQAPTVDDAPLVHACLEEAFADHWGHDPEPYASFTARHLEREDLDLGLWRVARLDDRMVGALVARVDDDGTAYVGRLGVSRSARGHGVGARLLTSAFAEYRDRGFGRATLSVDSESLTGATRLYESVGMHRTFTVMQLRADA